MLWSLVHQAHQGQPMGIKIGSCTLCLWTLKLNRAGMLQWSTLLFENSFKFFLSIFSSKCPRGQWINCISRSVTIIVFVLSQYFEFWICIQILETGLGSIPFFQFNSNSNSFTFNSNSNSNSFGMKNSNSNSNSNSFLSIPIPIPFYHFLFNSFLKPN